MCVSARKHTTAYPMQTTEAATKISEAEQAKAIAPFAEYEGQTPEIRLIKLDRLQTNSGCQMRTTLSPRNIQKLAEIAQNGTELDPIEVVEAEDGSLYLTNGYHRLMLYRQQQIIEARAKVIQGTLAYAQFLAAGANAQVSLERDADAIKRSVLHCLKAEETKDWPNGAIAKHVGTSISTARRIRKEFELEGAIKAPSKVAVTRGGQTYEMARPKKVKPEQPEGIDADVCQLYGATPNFKIMTPEQNAAWFQWLRENFETFAVVERQQFTKTPNAFVIRYLEDGHPQRKSFSGLRQGYEAWASTYFDYPQRPNIEKPVEEPWPSTAEVMQAVPAMPSLPTVEETVGAEAIANGMSCADYVQLGLGRYEAKAFTKEIVRLIDFQDLMDLIQGHYEAALSKTA